MTWTGKGAPNAAATDPPSAPPASMANTKSTVAASMAPSAIATPIHASQP